MTGSEFRVALDRLGQPLLLCDEDGLVRYATPEARELLGPRLEAEATTPLDTWLHDDQGILWAPDTAERHRDVSFVDHQGRRRTLRATVEPLPLEGTVGWMVRFWRPSSAARALAGVELLAGGIARQLGDQLGTILDRASTALLGHPDESTAACLRDILGAAQGAAMLQRQLQALAQPGAAPRPVALSELVEETVLLLGRRGAPRVHLEEASEGRDIVRADPAELRMALHHLADWVGAVCGVEARAAVRVLGGRDPVRLVLRAWGRPLPEPHATRLFHPFGPSSGGLALPVVAAVVERMGGRILVEPEPDGATVHLELPAAGAPSARTSHADRGTGRVFVVDDDAATRELVAEVIRQAGYTVVAAANGVEASVVLRRTHAELDLLLTDAVMPGRSGLELIAEARSLRPDLPILLMTGYAEDFLGPRIRSDIPILHKPFSPSELVQQVGRLLGDRPSS